MTRGLCVVVITINEHQATVDGLSVFHKEHTVAGGNDTADRQHIIQQLAVFGKLINAVAFLDVVTVDSDCADTGVHIGVFTEVVLSAGQGHPAALNVGRTNAVAGAGAVGSPGAHGNTVLVEGVRDAGNGLGSVGVQLVVAAGVAIHSVGSAAVDIVVTFVGAHILPALHQLAVDGVIQVAIHLNDAGAGGQDIAAALGLTDEVFINDLVIVALSLDDGAEVYDGLTALAVGTVLITSLGAGSGLVFHSGQLCIVHVVGRGDGGHLGSYIDGTAEGSAVHNTVNHVNINVDHGLVAHGVNRSILTRYIVESVECPNTDGDAHQGVVQSSCADSSVLLNGNGQQFGNCIVLESSLVAGSNDSTIGFPGVGVIQLQGCHQLVGSRQISNVDIHIVDGLCFGGLTGVVVATQGDGSITGHGEGSVQSSGVTQLVLNLELHGVNAGIQRDVTNGGQGSAGNGSAHFHTVHEDLTGIQIQSGIVSHSGRESEISAGVGLVIFQSHSGIGGGVSGVGDGGQHAVVHSGAVVQGDVVDVEGNDICGIGLNVSTNEGRRTGVRLIRRRHSRQIVVSADIDGCIDPTGLRNIRIGCRVQVGLLAGGSRSEHKVALHTRCFSVHCPVGIGIELGLECKALTSSRECILRNVDPHTQGGSLQAVGNVTENNNIIGVKEDIISPTCKISIGVVQAPSQCIVTVSYLTTLGGRRNKGIALDIVAKLASQRIGANQGVVDAVIDGPLLCFLEAHEASLVAIFKVPDDLGTLTEGNGVGQNNLTVGDGHIHTFDSGIGGGSKAEAIQSAGCLVGQSHGNGVGIHIDIGFTDHCNDRQSNGANLFGSGVRNGGGGCGELEDLRVSNVDGLGADHLAAGDHLHIHSTLGAVGDELAVFNGAEGSIGQSPAYVSRHIHSIAMGVDGFCAEGVNGLGSENVVVGFNIDHIQLAGGSYVGSNEDTVSGGTLRTVTGDGAHGEGFFANTLGQEGGGTATVTVGSPLTAQSQHSFALFVRAEAHRVVGATAVVHTDDQGAVFLNAHHGTGSIIIAALLSGVDQLAVLDDHGEGNTHSVQQDTVSQILFNLSLVVCLDIAGDVALCVLEDIQDGGSGIQNCAAGSYILVGIADPLTIVDQNTGGVGVVVQVGVHTADDVVAKRIFVVLGHLGQFLVRPVGLIFQILVDLVVAGNDGDIGVRRVNLNDVEDLSAGACSVIQNDLRLNCSAGDKDVILFRDYVVVTVGAKRGAVKDHVVLFPVGDRGKRGHRQNADEHHNCQSKGYYAHGSFSHFFSSFRKIYNKMAQMCQFIQMGWAAAKLLVTYERLLRLPFGVFLLCP